MTLFYQIMFFVNMLLTILTMLAVGIAGTIIILEWQKRKELLAAIAGERENLIKAIETLSGTNNDLIKFRKETEAMLKIHTQQLGALTTAQTANKPGYQRV